MAGGRLLSMVLLLASVTVTASALVGEHGIPHLIGLRAEREDLGRTAFALLEENARLRDELRRLKKDDLYLEQLARRQLGLVKPGEIVYRFRRSTRDGRPRR
ncbi:MAG: septum formation initiator family protein [Deltaproteobacteria bacterium]|nr:MAG: septum formation initiator family protein [Deltaproteobacteria bacterium]